jgi:hypothetical protein
LQDTEEMEEGELKQLSRNLVEAIVKECFIIQNIPTWIKRVSLVLMQYSLCHSL